MGEVFRANDTRLHRTVAIKVLPHEKVADPERKRRFLQEARAASALNHSNIVTLHDIANDAGVDYIVMEYVAGKSLDQILAAKRSPLAEMVGYAIQVAGALAAAAHVAGIVHRDIKPANLMVTEESQVKVLDFGLAKLVERPSGSEGETQTQESALTEGGAVMGTAAYMSPEQASGRPLDHRTDIFSLGVVLFEMLAGERPFRGKSQVETMHAIINDAAPPIPDQPPELEEILAKALAKDPKERYQHAGDLAIDLRRFQKAWETKSLPSMRVTPAAAKKRIGWAVAVVILVLATAAGWWEGQRRAAVPEGVSLTDVSITPFTAEPGYEGESSISPDGQTIAYVSDRTGRFDIFLRQIGSSSDVALTHDQGDNIQPAFSPDGRQIAFVSSRSGGSGIFYPGFDNPTMGGDIWVMPKLGGAARRIAKDANFPSWSPDGSKILFAKFRRASIFEVAAAGGEPREIPAGPLHLYYPGYSSDGRWIFFEDSASGINAIPAAGGSLQHIATGRHPVWDTASEALIYNSNREGDNHSLWSVPFSLKDGRPSGKPHAITIGRGRDWQPAVSKDGKLIAYTAIETTFNLETVPFDSEAGKVLGSPRVLTSGNQIIFFMRFSPDGRSVIYESSRGAGRHIWRVDTGANPVQLTFDPGFEETFPQWSPDGSTIAFTRQPAQSPNSKSLWLMEPDGSNPRQILEGGNLSRWLPDGSGLVYQVNSTQLFIYDRATSRSRQVPTEPDLATMHNVSPDGLWIVYQSVAPGKNVANVDAHAVRLAGGSPRVVAATPRQDYHPFFSPSGRWVYFQPDHKNLYRVPGPAQDWKPAEPVKVTDFPESGLSLEDPQISRDGKQFLFSRGRITGDIWILRRGPSH